MKWLSINYWIENYVLGALKNFLNKSGEGWKTFVGLVLVLVHAFLETCQGAYCLAIQHYYDLSLNLPFSPIKDAGIVLMLTGIVHKMLNFGTKEQ